MRSIMRKTAFIVTLVAAELGLLAMTGVSQAEEGKKFKVVVLIGSVANEGSFNQVAIIALKKLAPLNPNSAPAEASPMATTPFIDSRGNA